MARLYADENFAYPVVAELRRLGHDVLTAQEAGQANQSIPDDAVLAFAAARQRAVLTFNRRHFVRLHTRGRSHAGVIVCTRDPDTGGLAARIHEAVSSCPALDAQLIRITRPRQQP
jgi:hypothetical protein